MAPKAMTLARFNAHWRVLEQCEATGARPRVYRELLEEITHLRVTYATLLKDYATLQRGCQEQGHRLSAEIERLKGDNVYPGTVSETDS